MRIVVVEARGLPTGFLGCYGNEWIATPCLDRLAADGVVFDQHFAETPDLEGDTPPWRAAPHLIEAQGKTLQVEDYLTCERLDELKGFGKRAGAAIRRWHTKSGVLWIDGPVLAPPWCLDEELLATYFEDEAGEPWPDPPFGLAPDLQQEDLLRLHNTFAAAVTYFDAQLETLLEALADAPETALCLTARCGLNLGEHGLIGPARAWLHEEVVHVPLVLRFPRAEHAGMRIGALTQPVDLVEYLNQLLQGTNANPKSLGSLILGEGESIRPHATSRLKIGASAESSLRTLEWCLLTPTALPADDHLRVAQLFVKPDDRWEVNDVYQMHPEASEALEATLRATEVTAERSDSPPRTSRPLI